MNRNIKKLVGYSLKETDGEIGNIEDFYFDDISWKIRYLVVRTGNWFTGRKVLISPKSIQKPDWEHEEFQVSLTKEQIKNSPDIDTESRFHGNRKSSCIAIIPGEPIGAMILMNMAQAYLVQCQAIYTTER